MTNRQKFMFTFGAGVAVLVGGLLMMVVPWWVYVPAGCVAGAGGILFAPRSKAAITASEMRELSAGADNVSEADWQASSELETEDLS